jgi:hypothetical protein
MSRPILHTIEALTKILDSQCGNPSYAVAAARAGCSVQSLFRWRQASANGDASYNLSWMDIEASFASHLALARIIYMGQVEAAALDRALRGTREKVFYQGKPSWQLDPRYENWSDDDLQTLGLSNEDRYLHDDLTHSRIQHEVEHAPPVELQKAALAAYSKKWQATSHVDVNAQVALGVTMVGNRPKPSIYVTPRPAQIERKGAPTEISGVFEEVVAEPKIPHVEVKPDIVEPTSDVPTVPVRGNPAVDRNPDSKIRQELLAEQEIRSRRVAQESAAGHRPAHAPPPTPPELLPDIDRDLSDDGTTPTKPAPPTMDAVAEKIHAVKKKLRDNVPMSAIERQVAAALKRGDDDGARKLLGYRAPRDGEGLGAGSPGAGGAAIATTASTRNAPQKMV